MWWARRWLICARVVGQAKAAASASVAVPQPSATKETATLHQAKVVALQSQLVSTRTELEEARALIAQQQQVMAERVFARYETNRRGHAPAAPNFLLSLAFYLLTNARLNVWMPQSRTRGRTGVAPTICGYTVVRCNVHFVW